MQTTRIPSSEITGETIFMNRRELLRVGATAAIGVALAGCPAADEAGAAGENPDPGPADSGLRTLANVDPAPAIYRVDEKTTRYSDATGYNNFYEFGTGKRDPAKHAHTLKTKPWSIVVDGEVGKPGRVDVEDIMKPSRFEERIYRFRCVETWSMVVPWVGIPLGNILKRFEPTSKARYVSFETLVDRKQMPGQKRRVIDWPYREGLRMDEAMNPLSILAVGMYGSENQPNTSWNDLAPDEYGFYANVNPEVDHPRWSQARERKLGDFRKRPTLAFNGYADQVASLYSGMDLRRNF